MGVIGLKRADKEDRFTFEDSALLDSMAAHINSAIRSARLTAQLGEAREMELLSQWSNMVVHDFKNYLTPLRLISQNIVKHRDRPDIADIVAKDVDAVADTMESLVKTLSKLRESHKLSKEPIQLDELLRTTLAGMQIKQNDSIQVVKNYEAKTPVFGDHAMLRRVFENLFTNAVEAMGGSGVVTISTAELGDGNGSTSIMVSVADNGPGLTEDFIQNKLFKPFSTTKRNGSGLGLYQCRAILRAHDGTLHVENRPGGGADFRVLLPAAVPSDEEKDLATVPSG